MLKRNRRLELKLPDVFLSFFFFFFFICPKSEDQLSPSALGLGNSGDCGHSGREIFETIAKT